MWPRTAVLGGVDARAPYHWGLRWSPLYGPRKLSWVALAHQTLPLEPAVEPPMEPRNAVLGG
eukprot:3484989-Pyramimonas_sp.AAC.1